jgi:hypothetical protein
MTISETIRDAHARLLNMIGDEIAFNYSQTCPVDTGRLRDNAQSIVRDDTIDIYLQFYWKYLEWGTKTGIRAHHTFENAFNDALDTILLDNDNDDHWLLYVKRKLNNNRELLKVKINDTHIEK